MQKTKKYSLQVSWNKNINEKYDAKRSLNILPLKHQIFQFISPQFAFYLYNPKFWCQRKNEHIWEKFRKVFEKLYEEEFSCKTVLIHCQVLDIFAFL